jgi:hypothetical protein
MNGYPYSPSQLGVRPAPALVQQLLVGAFGWMFAGLLLTSAVAYMVTASLGLTSTIQGLWLPLIIGQLILGMALQLGINRFSATVGLLLFFVYAASIGLVVGVVVQHYAGESVVAAFVSTAAMFGGAALFGAVTKRSLAGVGGLASLAVIGLFVAIVVNVFLRSTMIGFLISIIGVVLFTALTAWDVQRIVSGQYAAITRSAERASVLAAFHLYLDAINLFLFLLRIFGGGRR